jgi:hypothetical protein
MRRTTLPGLPVFLKTDLPNMATHGNQDECGFSIYRGVLIQWDEDEDTRVVGFISAMPEEVRDGLLVIQEHEGNLGFIWADRIPKGYNEGDQLEVNGDVWTVMHSVAG